MQNVGHMSETTATLCVFICINSLPPHFYGLNDLSKVIRVSHVQVIEDDVQP